MKNSHRLSGGEADHLRSVRETDVVRVALFNPVAVGCYKRCIELCGDSSIHSTDDCREKVNPARVGKQSFLLIYLYWRELRCPEVAGEKLAASVSKRIRAFMSLPRVKR